MKTSLTQCCLHVNAVWMENRDQRGKMNGGSYGYNKCKSGPVCSHKQYSEAVATQALKVTSWHLVQAHHQDYWLCVYTRHEALCLCVFAYKIR